VGRDQFISAQEHGFNYHIGACSSTVSASETDYSKRMCKIGGKVLSGPPSSWGETTRSTVALGDCNLLELIDADSFLNEIECVKKSNFLQQDPIATWCNHAMEYLHKVSPEDKHSFVVPKIVDEELSVLDQSFVTSIQIPNDLCMSPDICIKMTRENLKNLLNVASRILSVCETRLCSEESIFL
jgi:hypothetical protein